jgi:hypothetical protein
MEEPAIKSQTLDAISGMVGGYSGSVSYGMPI